MVKRLVLGALLMMAVSGCSRIVTQEPLFIDSNVTADVYSGDKKIGTTPFLATLEPRATEFLSLRKEGYETRPIKIKKKVISYLALASDEKKRESDYGVEITEVEPAKILAMSISWIIFSPIIVPAVLFFEHPATYAQSMYYIEMKPEK